MNKTCVIQTYTGRFIDPLNFQPRDFNITDIAHALSLTCRWSGMCSQFYSVAEHSLECSYHCEEPLWALLHDAGEAYLTDIARPIKALCPDFIEAENRILETIADVLGLVWPMPECVKETDKKMLVTEQEILMPAGPLFYPSLEKYDILLKCHLPKVIETYFLERYRELTNVN